METSKVPVLLPDGARIWIETTPVRMPTEGDIAATTYGEADFLSFESLHTSISSVCKVIKNAISDATPKSASVEFGVEVGVDSGKLTALLVKGSAKANLKITLSW